MVDVSLALREEADNLAGQLFGNDRGKRASFTNRLLETYSLAQDIDLLLIHNPGGWGSSSLQQLLKWERSLVEGVCTTVDQLGYRWRLVQYFRNGNSWWAHLRDLKEQTRFFFKGKYAKAGVMAAELEFITRHLNTLRVVLIGVSQGAAFSNAVMRHLGESPRVFSIEMGIFFPHMAWRVITPRTLAIDSNGAMPDPMAQRNLKVGFRAYITAPSRWAKYRLQGKPVKFTYCVNAPGHDYNWEYPGVHQPITDFIKANFGRKNN